jgi:glycosyltransferase involved in cell wall biosynthesis
LNRLSVIIPAFNEEMSIVSAVLKVRDVLKRSGIQGEVVVVDDGSTDATGRLASDAGARVLSHGSNRGYGAALKTGIGRTDSDLLAIMDADGTYPAERIPDLIAAMEGAEMAVGSRTGGTVRIPLARKPAKWVLNRLANHLTGTRIPDLNSGLRVFTRNLAMRYMHLLPDGFSFTTTVTVASLCDGLPVAFVPVDYHTRVGTSKIRPGHFAGFLMLVFRLAVLFRPLKVFLPVSLALFLAGLLKLSLDMVIAVGSVGLGARLLSFPVISTSTVIFLVSGLQVLLVGMVAEALAVRR